MDSRNFYRRKALSKVSSCTNDWRLSVVIEYNSLDYSTLYQALVIYRKHGVNNQNSNYYKIICYWWIYDLAQTRLPQYGNYICIYIIAISYEFKSYLSILETLHSIQLQIEHIPSQDLRRKKTDRKIFIIDWLQI